MPRVETGFDERTGLFGLESAKKLKLAEIDAQTSAAILAGFDYSVEGETLHFSYDSFDQQNFVDSASAALALGGAGQAFSVTWNGYRPDGSLARLTLDAASFLALYTQGALPHKAACMDRGGQRKALLEQAATQAELEAI